MYTLDKKTTTQRIFPFLRPSNTRFSCYFFVNIGNFQFLSPPGLQTAEQAGRLPFNKVIRMDGSGLFHRELIAVQVLVQGAADIVLAAVEDGLQNAGMGPADGFVLVGLQAELFSF